MKILYLSDGETSKLIKTSFSWELISVEKGITKESISLTVINESSTLATGIFDEILKDSFMWIIFTVLGA